MTISPRAIAAAALLAVTAVSAFAFMPHPAARRSLPVPPPAAPDVPVAPDPGKQTDFETAQLTGTLMPGDSASLSVMQPGRVVFVGAANGDTVQAEATLLRLDNGIASAQVKQAEGALASAQDGLLKAQAGGEAQEQKAANGLLQAQSDLKQAQLQYAQALLGLQGAQSEQKANAAGARSELDKARIGVEQAKQTVDGLKALKRVGGVSQQQMSGAAAQLQVARDDFRAARTRLQTVLAGTRAGVPFGIANARQKLDMAKQGVQTALKGVQAAEKGKQTVQKLAASEVQTAQAGIAQAEAGVQSARTAQQFNVIRSPIAGIVSGLSLHIGEMAQPGMPLLTVQNAQGAHVDALAAGSVLAHLHTGEKALIHLPQWAGKDLQARLVRISSVAEADGRSFKVKFELVKPPAHLPLGMHVDIMLQTQPAGK